jgi:hypothetical protein
MRSKWLDWTPSFEGFVGSVSEENPIIHVVEPRIIENPPGEGPAKPPKPPAGRKGRDLEPVRRALERSQGVLPFERDAIDLYQPGTPNKGSQSIRAAKPAVLEALRSRPATCAASCYEIDAGRWIHHPWDGCTTIQPEVGELHKVQEMCWHCHGQKRCDCIACWQAGPSECVTCKGSGQVWRWV